MYNVNLGVEEIIRSLKAMNEIDLKSIPVALFGLSGTQTVWTS